MSAFVANTTRVFADCCIPRHPLPPHPHPQLLREAMASAKRANSLPVSVREAAAKAVKGQAFTPWMVGPACRSCYGALGEPAGFCSTCCGELCTACFRAHVSGSSATRSTAFGHFFGSSERYKADYGLSPIERDGEGDEPGDDAAREEAGYASGGEDEDASGGEDEDASPAASVPRRRVATRSQRDVGASRSVRATGVEVASLDNTTDPAAPCSLCVAPLCPPPRALSLTLRRTSQRMAATTPSARFLPLPPRPGVPCPFRRCSPPSSPRILRLLIPGHDGCRPDLPQLAVLLGASTLPRRVVPPPVQTGGAHQRGMHLFAPLPPNPVTTAASVSLQLGLTCT